MANHEHTSRAVEAPAQAFEPDYLHAARRLRASVAEALCALKIESGSSREISRCLGLDKSLAWKLARVAGAEDLTRMAECVPRAAATRLVINALRDSGAAAPLADTVEAAFSAFDAMAERHAGSRDLLEIMVNGMGPAASDGLAKSRKLAFRGNVGIWGLQATARLSAHFLALDESGRQISYAQLGGLFGFRRHRPGPGWPLFSFHTYNDDRTLAKTRLLPLGRRAGGGPDLILHDLCRGQIPEITMPSDLRTTTYELGDSPVGLAGECDLYFGYLDTVPKTAVRDEHNRLGEVLCVINTPIETLVLDLLVQRELADRINPEVLVYGRATGHPHGHELRDERSLIPFAEQMQAMRPGYGMTDSSHVPAYGQAADLACGRLGRTLDDFVGWRLVMPYPVMPSTASFRFDLPAYP